MTLDEAIKHAEEVAEEKRCEKCGEEHLINNMVEDEDTGGYYCEACWDEKKKEEEENV